MKTSNFFLPTTLLASLMFCCAGLVGAQAEREFFVFQNGVHFSSDKAGAAALKELGYDGIGSAKLPGLKNRIATYREQGLNVHSIYTGATLQKGKAQTLDPAIVEAMGLLDKHAVVEFTLRGNPTDAQAATFMQGVAEQAGKHGLDVVLYPHSGFFVDTVGDGVRIAKLAQRDNLGVMFNLCHFLKVEPTSDLKQTLTDAKPWLKQISTCGADKDGTNWGQLIQPLDQGSFDQAALFALLDELGFEGKVGLQCYAIKGDAKTNLTKSMNAWKALQVREQ